MKIYPVKGRDGSPLPSLTWSRPTEHTPERCTKITVARKRQARLCCPGARSAQEATHQSVRSLPVAPKHVLSLEGRAPARPSAFALNAAVARDLRARGAAAIAISIRVCQSNPVARTTCCPGASTETSVEAQEVAGDARVFRRPLVRCAHPDNKLSGLRENACAPLALKGPPKIAQGETLGKNKEVRQALKGRPKTPARLERPFRACRPWDAKPRVSPWAIVGRPVGAAHPEPATP